MPEIADRPKIATCPQCGERTGIPHCLAEGCVWVDCRTCRITINPQPVRKIKTTTGLIDAPANTIAYMEMRESA